MVQISVITGPIFSLWLFKVNNTTLSCAMAERSAPRRDRYVPDSNCTGATHHVAASPVQGMPLNGEPSTVAAYAALLLAFGLMKSWSAPACNNPIFSMLVPAHCRNLIYAFDRYV